jgi:hypothetical protein
MALEQSISFFSGNDVELNYTITDDAGAPKDLTGAAAIIWVMAKAAGKAGLVTKGLGTGVTITTPTQGKFKVTLVPADTEGIKGGRTYYHEARVTDSVGKKVTVTYGDLLLMENSITT